MDYNPGSLELERGEKETSELLDDDGHLRRTGKRSTS